MTDNFKSIFSREQVMALLKNDTNKNVDDNNKNKVRTNSPYGQMLRESKKISSFYGDLSKKYLQKIFYKSCNQPSKVSENLFLILESRLDVVLYRSGFLESIASARQIVRTGGIKVNNKKVISPSYFLRPGDIISVFGDDKKRQFFEKYLNNDNLLTNKNVKNSLTLPRKKLGWRFKGSPLLLSKISKLYQNSVPSFTQATRSSLSSLAIANNINTSKDNALILINTIKRCIGLNFHKEKKNDNKSIFNNKSLTFFDCVAQFNETIVYHNIASSYFNHLMKQPNLNVLQPNYMVSLLAPKANTEDMSCMQINDVLSKPLKDKFIAKLSNVAHLENEKSSKINHTKNLFLLPLAYNYDNIFSVKERNSFFTFLNYLLNLKKQYLSLQKKKINSKKQQHQSFFKNQNFFSLKRTKPLHLEVSYKSLSIIFLFPPQRINFPSFVNPSLIYK